MKKNRLVFDIFLFFVCVFFCYALFFNFNFSSNKTFALKIQKPFVYEFLYNGKIFRFNENEFEETKNLSQHQKEMRSKKIETGVKILENMGFSKQESLTYIFPETKTILKKLKQAIEFEPESETISVIQNSCDIEIQNGSFGVFVDSVDFFEKFYKELLKQTNQISFKIKTNKFELPKINRFEYLEKSCFSTNFETSSEARKNNIKVALSCFDGLVLEDGEVLSFNSTTGVRNADAGYMPAKIISGGTFTEGFGGGVCQVSTTLYNACLLAGLDILEVHNHSLPVSYIEPSFDAMVNIGSSDLVIRNNSGGRLIFTTSSKNDVCKIKIFGKANEFKITRFSEKTKIIPAEKEEVITDPKKAEEFGVFAGEEKRISYKKDGFCSNGYLNFYDKKGNLIKTKKIRSNTYNPTKGVVIKREA